MKSLTINPILATAALLLASTVASAADMRFEIPFAFHAGGKVMAPGGYLVRASSGEARFFLQNTQSSEGVHLLGLGEQDPRKEWKDSADGVMQFE
jgi:hypothetical protein